jgi:PAS domain S-box-containing protein
MIESVAPAAALQALLDALESAGLGCTVILAHPDRVERVYANAAIAKIYGVDVETMRRLDTFDALDAEQRQRLTDLRWAVRGGAPAPPMVATTIERPDGTRVPVELGLGYAMVGDVRATFVFARDATANVAMEAALRESEERFRSLAEASPDSITVYSDECCVYANPVALRQLGLRTREELATYDVWSRVPPERREAARERVAKLRAGEQVAPVLSRVTTADGQESVFESSLSLVTLAGAPAIVSWARDITERLRLQAEIMKQDRLASVGLLAAGVAHELNNPLTSLSMQARKLRDEADQRGLDADVRASLERMDDAAQRMTSIIADLLSLARPASQPQAHVDVAKVLTSTVALLRAGLTPCPRVTVDLEPLPAINGYASKLGQVFLNVLKNAVQAVEGMPEGEVRVRGRVSRDALEIVVQDNGAGIQPDVLPRVSQPFFTTKPHGTGLGLWISHELLAQHGGRLDLTSVPGEGTKVTIALSI